VILITSTEDAGSRLITRLYPVLDLVTRRTLVYEANSVGTSRTGGSNLGAADYESLIDCIITTIDPDSWDDVGGPGSISHFDNAGILIIAQTPDVHPKIGALLDSLRRVKGLQGLPTIAPRARMSSPVMPTEHGASGDREDLSAVSVRRRIVTPKHSWQLPQVYEE
jgi:hypothetical protein